MSAPAVTAPPASFPPLQDTAFREVFRRHAAGVAIITAADDDTRVGFTATSLTSLSAQPPLVSFNLSRTASSWPVVSRATHVGIHVLADSHRDLAQRFATSGIDRFAEPTRSLVGPYGVPLLTDVGTWLVAQVLQQVPAGDSTLVLAQVLHAAADGAGAPLLYHDRRFQTLDADPGRASHGDH